MGYLILSVLGRTTRCYIRRRRYLELCSLWASYDAPNELAASAV